jgi:hypothetical protein
VTGLGEMMRSLIYMVIARESNSSQCSVNSEEKGTH